MQLKILPLILLLILLLTQTSYAQTLPESPNGRGSNFGIELQQFYPGTLVMELMEAAEDEIDTAVRDAYAEGYKAAMLRYAPDAEAYKLKNETLHRELETMRKKNWFVWPSIGVSIGVSFAVGFLINSLISR